MPLLLLLDVRTCNPLAAPALGFCTGGGGFFEIPGLDLESRSAKP